jgi:hypothetical protein
MVQQQHSQDEDEGESWWDVAVAVVFCDLRDHHSAAFVDVEVYVSVADDALPHPHLMPELLLQPACP